MSKIPQNKILASQYTVGGEFVYKSSFLPYRGYYHVFGGVKYFTEKEPTSNSKEIIRPIINQQKIDSVISKPTQTRYVVRVESESPIRYKFIDETTYSRLKSIKGYQVIIIPAGEDLNLFSNYPGLKEFLKVNP
jgi:hypothetical protein